MCLTETIGSYDIFEAQCHSGQCRTINDDKGQLPLETCSFIQKTYRDLTK